MRGGGAQFLREGCNKLSISAVGATAELKFELDFRFKWPHDEAVFQPTHHERMDKGHAEPRGHKFAYGGRHIRDKNNLGGDPIGLEHLFDTMTGIGVRIE